MPIELKDVSYVYEPGTPNEKEALSHVDLTLPEGQFIGIIGHTGSGKSTMIQMLNGLIRPTGGKILLNGMDIFEEPSDEEVWKWLEQDGAKNGKLKKPSKKQKKAARAKKMLSVRKKVGLVFQYPEHQLFEMTIGKDIAFGPSNLGLTQEEIDKRVKRSMKMVGLDESYMEKSPFELSGGQKRRVAIAGVLAMEPDFLILDEPTAGLDPKGRDEILGQMRKLKDETGITILLVSHSMEDVAKYADYVVAMDSAKVRYTGTPAEVFTHTEELRAMGLNIPQVTELAEKMKAVGFTSEETILNLDQMEAWLMHEVIRVC